MTLCNSLFFFNAKIIEMVSKLVVLGIKGGLGSEGKWVWQ